MREENRTAIITGAAGMRGIGRAIALRFAQAGLKIALIDIDRPSSQTPDHELAAGWRGLDSVRDEIVAMGQDAVAIYADLSDPAQISGACARAIETFGTVDVLVNNARAVLGRDQELVVDLDISEWDRVMAVNARGVFLLSQAVARHMISRKAPGHIINISSIAAKDGRPRQAAYSASKFAVNGFTQVLARELGEHRINVNAICPGLVDTGRFSQREKDAALEAGISAQELAAQRFSQRTKDIALGRPAVAEDIAGVAAFLISPDARHITGQAINVDGGEIFH